MMFRDMIASALIASLLVLPAPTLARKPTEDRVFQAKLNDKDSQVLHALDRLTFGPRPGDVDQVRRMGVKKWVDLELHPERIKESELLSAKLEPLESLRMTPQEVTQHY